MSNPLTGLSYTQKGFIMKVFFAVLAALFVFGVTDGGDEPPAPTSQAVLAASFESEVVPVTEVEGRPIATVHSDPVPVTVPAPGTPEPVPAPAAPVAAPVAEPAPATPAPVATPDQAPAPAPAPTRDPYEDEPGWDCATMGNRICGSTYTEAVILPDLLYPVAPAPVVDAPMEDEPGWDCRTMGNKICGSDLTTITGH